MTRKRRIQNKDNTEKDREEKNERKEFWNEIGEIEREVRGSRREERRR